eukprot:GILI01033223.1.p1 GENE.GILI01033223.1~~GILI01033223.1.p1  ORF type:complete len:111 (+),score=12.62 GILI01033223.1:44-376(+)
MSAVENTVARREENVQMSSPVEHTTVNVADSTVNPPSLVNAPTAVEENESEETEKARRRDRNQSALSRFCFGKRSEWEEGCIASHVIAIPCGLAIVAGIIVVVVLLATGS